MPRSRSKGGRLPTDRPARWISPPSGERKPAIRLSVVVLPQPLGPSRVTNSPGATSRSMPSTAVIVPKRFVSLRSCSAGSATSLLLEEEVADADEAAEDGDEHQRDDQRDDRQGREGRREAVFKEAEDGHGDRSLSRARDEQREVHVGEAVDE